MTTWTLVLLFGGWLGVADIKFREMPELACKELVREFAKADNDGLGAGCFGPNGESFTVDDARNESK